MSTAPDVSPEAVPGLLYALGWLLPVVPGLLCALGVIGGVGFVVGIFACVPVMLATALALRATAPDAR